MSRFPRTFWCSTIRKPCGRFALFARRYATAGLLSTEWIRMVATNRLTGHSKGFFSVYTLPPNQAVSIQSQRRINEQRKQAPDARDVAVLIRRKSRSLLSKVSAGDRNMLSTWGPKSILMTGSCDETPAIPDESVTLVVTSPPFLDVVDYETDNWLRCWFNHVDPKSIKLWMFKRVEEWSQRMTIVFRELNRVLKRDGFVAFEVGEVRNGKLRLEDFVIPAAEQAGLKPVLVLVNQQEFTKTSNCWGVSNMSKGTNTNRVVSPSKTIAAPPDRGQSSKRSGFREPSLPAEFGSFYFLALAAFSLKNSPAARQRKRVPRNFKMSEQTSYYPELAKEILPAEGQFRRFASRAGRSGHDFHCRDFSGMQRPRAALWFHHANAKDSFGKANECALSLDQRVRSLGGLGAVGFWRVGYFS